MATGKISTVKDLTVLITGGAMGMGKLYAQYAAAEGARAIVLWDVNKPVLEATVKELSVEGVRAYGAVVDLTDVDAIEKAASEFLAAYGAPDVVILNAGVVKAGYFWEHDSRRDSIVTMQVNALAPMHVAHEFIPAMIRDSGRPKRIVTVASAAGLIANPKMSVYVASKFAAVGWSESLRLEFVKAGHDHVKVTTVCPSYVATDMFKGAKGMPLVPILTPEKITTDAWNAMKNGDAIVVRPRTVSLAYAARAVLPTSVFDFVATHLFHLYNTMDDFVGHGKKHA